MIKQLVGHVCPNCEKGKTIEKELYDDWAFVIGCTHCDVEFKAK